MGNIINTAPLSIRRCTIADTEALTELARTTFRDTFFDTCTEADMQHFLDTHIRTERIAIELSDPDHLTFFALINDQPAGFVYFGAKPLPYETDSTVRPLELIRLYVAKEWLGHGVGRKLMEYYLDYAAQHGYNYCWLGVWEHNYRAQKFYSKFGFTFSGHTHPFPIGDTPQTDQWWYKTI